MSKKKICNLNVGDLFEHKGVIYEVWRKEKWTTECRYVNEKAYTGYYGGYNDYLYCCFSNYTVVEV